jgi:hypothetical protein
MGVRIADFRLWNTKDLNTPQRRKERKAKLLWIKMN